MIRPSTPHSLTLRPLRNHSRHTGARRRGQALLLAVLLMLFVALLGATFVSVVALNLNQSAREEDRSRSVQAAQAGLTVINEQLTNSPQGSQWDEWTPATGLDRPSGQDIVIAKATAAPNTLYYSEFERAQGWAGDYAKFPDPREKSSETQPHFLAKVERVLPNDPVGDNADNSRTNALRITVIGQSLDNPAAFTRTVRYKSSELQNQVTGFARTATLWDSRHNTVPAATIVAGTAALAPGGTLPLTSLANTRGQFPIDGGPFYVTVKQVDSATPARGLRGAVVSVASATGGAVMTFHDMMNGSSAGAAPPQGGDRIEMASALGTGDDTYRVDFDDSGTIDPTTEDDATKLDVSTAASTSGLISTPGSVWSNGGLLWLGRVTTDRLLRPQDAQTDQTFAPPPSTNPNGDYTVFDAKSLPGVVRSAGLMVVPGTGSAVGKQTLSYFPSGTTDTTTATVSPQILTSSTDANWPSNLDQIISDGANADSNNPTSAGRRTRAVRPPDLTAGSSGISRYRELTKYSQPTQNVTTTPNPNPTPNANLYGYGQGIHLNNPQDRERLYNAGPDNIYGNADDLGFRDMTQQQLLNLWLSADAASTTRFYERSDTPKPLTASTYSLEEQHLRGWIAPDEFVPRGALIELYDDSTGNARLSITLDSRADGRAQDSATTAYANTGPVATKAWRQEDGTLPAAGSTGAYFYTRRDIPWPDNGVIFAEGNIRIKGKVNDAPRSLTVVSMNNIYIEGSIDIDADDKTDSTTGDADMVDETASDPDNADPTLRDDHKVLLLARRNVVVNPTRVIGRPEASVIVPQGTTVDPATPQTLTVSDANILERQQWVYWDSDGDGTDRRTNGAEPEPWGRITDITNRTGTTGDVTVAWTNDAGVTSAGSPLVVADSRPLRLKSDPLDPDPLKTGMATFADWAPRTDYERIGAFNDVLQRVLLPTTATAPAGFRVALRHSADRVPLFKMEMDTLGQPTTNNKADLAMKGVTAPASAPAPSIIKAVEKIMSIEVTPGTDNFPNPPKTTQATAVAYDLQTLLTDIRNARMQTVPTTQYFYKPSFETTFPTNYDTPSPSTIYKSLPFYFLAALGNRQQRTGTLTTTPPIYRKSILADPYSIPLGTSVAVNLDSASNTTAAAANAVLQNDVYSGSAFEQVKQFGFSTDYIADADDSLTSDETFYTDMTPANFGHIFDSREVQQTGLAAGLQTMAMRFNNALLDPATPTSTLESRFGTAKMPAYRLARLKLDGVTLDPASGAFQSLSPGATFDIKAYVYAQEGSWFIIPGAFFDDAVAPAVVGTLPRPNVANNVDVDRDGVVTNTEKNSAYRYGRYNYKINFTGTIMENRPAIISDIGTGAAAVPGAVADWMNKWAAVTVPTGSTTPTLETITYTYDPDAARGLLIQDAGFYPPLSPELAQ